MYSIHFNEESDNCFGDGIGGSYEALCRPNGFIGGRRNRTTSRKELVDCKSCLKRL